MAGVAANATFTAANAKFFKLYWFIETLNAT
jgi:hypothetical protein